MHHVVGSRMSARGRVRGRIVAVALAVAALAVVFAAPAAQRCRARRRQPRSRPRRTTSSARSSWPGTPSTRSRARPCTGACLKSWKPVVLPDGETSATAGSGVDEAKLGTKATSGGAEQITYGGKPLYWSTKDKAPGDVKGAGSDKFGKWSVVVTAKASGGSGTNAGTGDAAF